ncbi:PAAR domain-containing protein [Sulfidibacter corallicola]|uniref:PAAR domain-containing protein n=1 Tax=Sulfidibacter corallicola TaxID=2818388 RepID=A0A8A4TX20_SULCO|nr:PAAR domain-containing protein [Sulfidibacter corallicola]QTD51065.1 PAAR domain-containing protein [Sulfidibacter corallicola]
MANLPAAPRPEPSARPTNVLHDIANGINKVVTAPAQAVMLVNEGFAKATNFIANALPSFPAATLGSLAIGAPHAHVLHPPSGPPPIPPTPLPSIGNVLLGTSVQVLVNSKPAARAGDIGLAPTCCGLPPFYEIFTGSSNVFIAGARAARVTDVTFHCKPVPSPAAAARGAAAAMQKAMKAAMIGGMVATGLGIAGDAIEAVEADNSHMAGALALNASMMAAQLAADVAAMAATAAMGKDICVPPGTPGMITMGSPNVMIGGFPMPSWMDIAKGLLKLVKGLRARRQGRNGRSRCARCPGGR